MSNTPSQSGWKWRQSSVLPGFGLTLGYTITYLFLIILIPLGGLIWSTPISDLPSSSRSPPIAEP